jgi:hypothetical protein
MQEGNGMCSAAQHEKRGGSGLVHGGTVNMGEQGKWECMVVQHMREENAGKNCY